MFCDSSLNERNYGDLVGLNKQETADKYGKDQVHIWRRSYDIPPPGGESLKNVVEYTKPYRFIDWEQINASEDSNSVDKVKSEISKYSYPVMIGISRYGKGLDNLYNDTDSDKGKDGIFKPNFDDKVYDGHMMTIVGYDDNISGGAFRVVNSWGEEWGDGGYFWLKYKDFKIITTEAYILDLSSTINHTNNPQFNFDNFFSDTFCPIKLNSY